MSYQWSFLVSSWQEEGASKAPWDCLILSRISPLQPVPVATMLNSCDEPGTQSFTPPECFKKDEEGVNIKGKPRDMCPGMPSHPCRSVERGGKDPPTSMMQLGGSQREAIKGEIHAFPSAFSTDVCPLSVRCFAQRGAPFCSCFCWNLVPPEAGFHQHTDMQPALLQFPPLPLLLQYSFFLSFFFTEVVCQPADLGCSMENYLVFFLPNPQAPFTKHGDHSRPTADENRAKVVLRLRLVRSGLWSLPLLGGKQPSPAAGHHAVRAAGRRRWRNPPSEPEQSLCPKRAPNNALNG